MKMPNMAVACERTNMSDRAAAILTSAILENVEIVTPSSTNGLTD